MSVSMMGDARSRPPFIRFEERSVEDRDATIASGGLKMKAVDWVIVSQPGSKDTVEKEAKQWLEAAKHNPNFDPAWVDRFHTYYRMWKEGQEITPDGTHVRMWAPISKAEAEQLIASGLRTVEDLAIANEQALQAYGIGARGLQQKARAWLESAAKTGKTAEEITHLRAKTESQDKQIEELREKIRQLARSAPKDEEAVTDDFLS